MFRPVRLVLVALVSLLVAGCRTSEIKNGNDLGLANDVPTGTVQSGYGSGHGDSIGGGGAAPALDVDHGTGKESSR
ncbi:MAG: hypothetical protein ACHQ50_08400 [Fimbriimonadales bacterium]